LNQRAIQINHEQYQVAFIAGRVCGFVNDGSDLHFATSHQK